MGWQGRWKLGSKVALTFSPRLSRGIPGQRPTRYSLAVSRWFLLHREADARSLHRQPPHALRRGGSSRRLRRQRPFEDDFGRVDVRVLSVAAGYAPLLLETRHALGGLTRV